MTNQIQNSNVKNIVIVGIGRWGKNLLREFNKIASVSFCFHKGGPKNKKWLKQNYPHIKTVNSYAKLLNDPEVDAIVVAAPIAIHYELTKKALLAGKDVFVEKPLATTITQSKELVMLAAKNKKILFVGHIFSYHQVLAKIKRLTENEPLKYARFSWNKFGTFNENIIYNLACHDIATALDLFGTPTKIEILENRGIVSNSDIISMRLNFKNNKSSHIYINRVSNFKNKSVLLVTIRNNIYLWENDRLLKINKTGTHKLIYKSTKTPLEIECTEFIKCIEKRKKPPTDGRFGLKVVETLSKF